MRRGSCSAGGAGIQLSAIVVGKRLTQSPPGTVLFLNKSSPRHKYDPAPSNILHWICEQYLLIRVGTESTTVPSLKRSKSRCKSARFAFTSSAQFRTSGLERIVTVDGIHPFLRFRSFAVSSLSRCAFRPLSLPQASRDKHQAEK